MGIFWLDEYENLLKTFSEFISVFLQNSWIFLLVKWIFWWLWSMVDFWAGKYLSWFVMDVEVVGGYWFNFLNFEYFFQFLKKCVKNVNFDKFVISGKSSKKIPFYNIKNPQKYFQDNLFKFISKLSNYIHKNKQFLTKQSNKFSSHKTTLKIT